ncbi:MULTISPECIES: DUF1517 domain-containing protein [unclassified Leptolyngbya]|uniref:DUF1517 domain-containing protein n=1 Tax=unclassified Leptolyngbya TaxID=2650499 RepID=UPI00168600DF|nr:DUF1517 domain-containing protein [Leptolyngbya sp. FACHB-8]MBD2154625.1 DUF1517 domain-containing protein [Leptolyngbya sp. FACHB-16]
MRDRFNQFTGQTRFVVCRIFIHLAGREVAPLLGVLNQAGQEAIDAEGDMRVLGEQLVRVCESLLEYETFWRSAANEGDVLWDEGEAGDYVEELFTDSATRYGSATDFLSDGQEDFAIPVTQNVVVMIAVALEGEVPELEDNLADITALKAGLKALINLHYRGVLRAIQIHFSPAQLGDELTSDQLIENFPELIPL